MNKNSFISIKQLLKNMFNDYAVEDSPEPSYTYALLYVRIPGVTTRLYSPLTSENNNVSVPRPVLRTPDVIREGPNSMEPKIIIPKSPG